MLEEIREVQHRPTRTPNRARPIVCQSGAVAEQQLDGGITNAGNAAGPPRTRNFGQEAGTSCRSTTETGSYARLRTPAAVEIDANHLSINTHPDTAGAIHRFLTNTIAD